MLFTSSGYCSHPKSNWKQWLCKIWGGRGANKAHYGKCASGVWAILWLTFWVASSTMNSRSLLILLSTIAGAWKRSGIPKNKEENVFPKEKSPEIKRAAYINTFCLCLSVVKDWVRKKCFTHKPFRRYWKRIQYGCCWRSLSLSSSSIAVFQTVYWRKCGE